MMSQSATTHDQNINLCNDLRMWYQLEKDQKYVRKELGNFCQQFGYSPIKTIAPSRHRRKQQKTYKTYKKYKNYKHDKKYKP